MWRGRGFVDESLWIYAEGVVESVLSCGVNRVGDVPVFVEICHAGAAGMGR
jgi:hypothetical protein